MNYLNKFNPTETYSELFWYDKREGSSLDKKMDELIERAEVKIPKGYPLLFIHIPIPIHISTITGAELGYIGFKYNLSCKPSPTDTAYHSLNAKFQALWAKPLALEFDYQKNWTNL